MANYMQGVFKPLHPEKYKGNVHNIVYRSSWELRMMSLFDSSTNVIQWSSEEIVIPYLHPADRKMHRYFTDFYVKRIVNGKIIEQILEIKPDKQTRPPVITGKKPTKTVLKEQATYLINQSKWAAASKYCQQKGWQFVVITEKHLGALVNGSNTIR